MVMGGILYITSMSKIPESQGGEAEDFGRFYTDGRKTAPLPDEVDSILDGTRKENRNFFEGCE